MEVWILDAAEDVARKAADVCAACVRRRPDARLGFAAGSTPQGLYAELVRRSRRGELDLSRIEAFALDEYVGAGPEDPRAFQRDLRESLLRPVGLAPQRTHLLAGDAADPEAEARAYEALIRARGGIDLQILGIGRNGHIGFNEPGSPLDSRTRVATLSPSTLRDNRLGEGPVRVLTMGIGTILEARALLLLATGPAKAPAVAAMLEGAVTPGCPASAIQRHGAATIVLDREAAAELHSTRAPS